MRLWSQQKREEYMELAESGDLQAQIFLGHAYSLGDRIERDEQKAIDWLGRAEQQGSQVASFRLAFYLVHLRKEGGIERLRELDAQGFTPATYELGNCYYTGLILPRNAELGVYFWEKAARAGHLLSKIKIYKHLQANAHLYKKPIYFSKAAWHVLLAARIIFWNADDPRILGQLR